MRKQMTGKMALGAGLAFLMAVSLTGCEMDRMDQEAAETKAEDPADETETAESGDNRTGEIPEETSRGIGGGEAAEPEEASGPDQEPDQPLFVETRRSYDGEWKDQRCLLRSRWDGLYVPVDGWDTLKDGLDQYNAEVSQETGERFKENLSLVREDPPEPGQEYYIEREIRVQRADSRIVSFWDMDSSYVGGAHGSYYAHGVNFDPASGKRLALSDVVTDLEAVYQYVKEDVKSQDDGSLYPEYEETLEAMFHNGSGDGGQLEWIMDRDGITVVFNPYVLGPWSEGSLESRMTFADCPDLLLETYRAGAGAAVQLSEGEPFYADWDRDGEKEEYIYTVQVDEETYTSSITLSRTGEGAETEAAGPWEAGDYGSLTDVWLLEAGDGRPFLWLEFSSENDLRVLEVFTLQNENGTLVLYYVGSSGDSMYGSFIGDPGHFLLYDRIDLLGTYMAYRSFHMGEDGMPEADGTVYTIPGNGDRGPVLRASAEIPVWIEGKEERIPAGTELVLRAAELPDETGAARAEAELPDGRHCELRIQKDRDQYRFRIGGMDENDCFESLGYAG